MSALGFIVHLLVSYMEYTGIPFGKQQVTISAARSFLAGIPKSRWTEKQQTDPHRSAIG
jgi:hypothetical protein